MICREFGAQHGEDVLLPHQGQINNLPVKPNWLMPVAWRGGQGGRARASMSGGIQSHTLQRFRCRFSHIFQNQALTRVSEYTNYGLGPGNHQSSSRHWFMPIFRSHKIPFIYTLQIWSHELARCFCCFEALFISIVRELPNQLSICTQELTLIISVWLSILGSTNLDAEYDEIQEFYHASGPFTFGLLGLHEQCSFTRDKE